MIKAYLSTLLLITNISFGYDIESFHTVNLEECTILIPKDFIQNKNNPYTYEYLDGDTIFIDNFYLIDNNQTKQKIHNLISVMKMSNYTILYKNIKGLKVIEFTSNLPKLKNNKHYFIIGKKFTLYIAGEDETNLLKVLDYCRLTQKI